VTETPVIVDTGPLVAFLVRDDAHHRWSADRFRELPAPFLTCEAVLTEAFHLVRRLPGGTARLFELLETGSIRVAFDLMDERRPLSRLMDKYADVPMSLADACVVRMAERVERASVLTLDRHFTLYRKHGRQPIPAIMPS
jgi:predicted nucleic acid-binding protein